MEHIKILDCTLRDGGRLFNCEFSDEMILDVRKRLEASNIDIIEMGFLRDEKTVNYTGNSTFFTRVSQLEKFLVDKKKTCLYLAFIDYGMFDFDTLENYNGKSIDGIRFGFTKKNFDEHRKDIFDIAQIIKEKGYKLFIQDVNTPGYNDKDLLELLDLCNSISPYSCGIVDTYGTMYADDLRHFWDIVNRNLDKDICIDFHSHNNYQMSFALAQEFIHISEADSMYRTIIIDATLNGMGKGAGNLNTELITDYLIRKKNYNYDFDRILDIIDDYLKAIKQNNSWGYTVPAMLSGIYRSHPNNMIYLLDKFGLSSRDIKVILSSLPPASRERYDYEKLNSMSREYLSKKIDDTYTLEYLRKIFEDKYVLLLLPGLTIRTHKNIIKDCIDKEKPLIVSVNFVSEYESSASCWCFFGSADRYLSFWKNKDFNPEKVILTSNIKNQDKSAHVINYERLVTRINNQFDTSSIMCLNLLKKCNVHKIFIAGFDGYSDNGTNYFDSRAFQSDNIVGHAKEVNSEIQVLFDNFCKSVKDQIDIDIITPSTFVIPA